MKNKILKAINNGLMNVLSTDIEDKDIDWDIPRADDSILPPVHSLKQMEHFIDISFYLCDATDVVYLVLDDGSEFPLHKFTNQNVDFIVFKASPEVGPHDIVIHNNLVLSATMKQWVSTHQFVSAISRNYDDSDCIAHSLQDKYGYEHILNILKDDINGYEHTYFNKNIKYNTKNIDKCPALAYCWQIGTVNGYQAYLPAIGELLFIHKYMHIINEILLFLHSDEILIEDNRYKHSFWSSTDESAGIVWTLKNGFVRATDKYLKYRIERDNCKVLPMYKKIN